LKADNRGRYAQVVHLITKLLAPGGYAFTGRQAENGDYLFQRGETPVPFQALSDGYRAFIGWVADLLYHVCFGSPSGKKLVENQGVVLVDEIDLHLHPKWQLQVIKTVAKALPKMQFVFTSHSPLVAGSLEWMNIITLKAGPKSNRTVAKRLKQSIHGLDADQILLSEFFGLKTTMATTKQRQLDDITARIRAGDANAPLQLIRQMSKGTEEDE
jgi:predicted ATP-binding protein involved in virulence